MRDELKDPLLSGSSVTGRIQTMWNEWIHGDSWEIKVQTWSFQGCLNFSFVFQCGSPAPCVPVIVPDQRWIILSGRKRTNAGQLEDKRWNTITIRHWTSLFISTGCSDLLALFIFGGWEGHLVAHHFRPAVSPSIPACLGLKIKIK